MKNQATEQSSSKQRGYGKGKRKSNASVKSQVRSLRRLLQKEDLGHKVRKALEAKIDALTSIHNTHKQSEKERQLAVRYHRIKFFERVKIERRIACLKRELLKDQLTTEAKEDALALLAKSEEDLQYVLHFPKGEKYVSLLKDAATPEAQVVLEQERDRLRVLVRQRVADERMLAEVNEGTEEECLSDQEPAGHTLERPDDAVRKEARAELKAGDGSSVEAGKVSGDLPFPSKKRQRAQEILQAKTNNFEAGNLAFEDDFFLDANTPTLPVTPSATRPLPTTAGKPSLAKMVESVGNNAAARYSSGNAAKKSGSRVSQGSTQGYRRLGMEKAGKTEQVMKIEAEDVAKKRTRAEGGRKRRKKVKT